MKRILFYLLASMSITIYSLEKRETPDVNLETQKIEKTIKALKAKSKRNSLFSHIELKKHVASLEKAQNKFKKTLLEPQKNAFNELEELLKKIKEDIDAL